MPYYIKHGTGRCKDRWNPLLVVRYEVSVTRSAGPIDYDFRPDDPSYCETNDGSDYSDDGGSFGIDPPDTHFECESCGEEWSDLSSIHNRDATVLYVCDDPDENSEAGNANDYNVDVLSTEEYNSIEASETKLREHLVSLPKIEFAPRDVVGVGGVVIAANARCSHCGAELDDEKDSGIIKYCGVLFCSICYEKHYATDGGPASKHRVPTI